MWPFKKKGIDIQPGESKDLFFDVPNDKEIGEIVLGYNDEYGNKYETRILVNFIEKKIMKQSCNMIKKVKDIPEKDRPRLVVDEEYLESYIKKQKS